MDPGYLLDRGAEGGSGTRGYGGYGNAVSAPLDAPARAPQAHQALGLLDNAAQELATQIDSLEARLSGVLGPMPPRGVGGSSEKATVPALIQAMFDKARMIEIQASRLRDIQMRLEI